jgi:hypothetical protein
MMQACKFEECWKKGCSFGHKKDFTEQQWQFIRTPVQDRCPFSWCVNMDCKLVHFYAPKRVQCPYGGKCTKHIRMDFRHVCHFAHPHQKDAAGKFVWKDKDTSTYQYFVENRYIKGW